MAPGATAQNDRDVEVYNQFRTRSGSSGGRFLDIAYADDGTPVAAFAEVREAPDKLVVMASNDGGHTWRLLLKSHYYFDTITGLSLDVASGFPSSSGDKRAYVGVTFGENLSGEGNNDPAEWVALISGPYDQKWKGAGHIAFVSFLPKSARLGFDLHPSTSVISLGPQNQQEYAVGQGEVQGKAAKILRGTAFAHPSLTHDPVNHETLLAFEDRAEGVVHLVRSPSHFHIARGGGLEAVFSTPNNDRRREHHPVVATGDGQVNITCLTGKPDPITGSYPLIMYVGITYNQSIPFVELPTIHPKAISAGDVQIREDTAYVAALCVIGSQPNQLQDGSSVRFCTSIPDPVFSQKPNRPEDNGRLVGCMAQCHQTIDKPWATKKYLRETQHDVQEDNGYRTDDHRTSRVAQPCRRSSRRR